MTAAKATCVVQSRGQIHRISLSWTGRKNCPVQRSKGRIINILEKSPRMPKCSKENTRKVLKPKCRTEPDLSDGKKSKGNKATFLRRVYSFVSHQTWASAIVLMVLSSRHTIARSKWGLENS